MVASRFAARVLLALLVVTGSSACAQNQDEDQGQVDELLLYLAPKLIGAGMDMASHSHAQGPLQTVAQALELEFRSVESIGPDLRLIARLAGRSGWFE